MNNSIEEAVHDLLHLKEQLGPNLTKTQFAHQGCSINYCQYYGTHGGRPDCPWNELQGLSAEILNRYERYIDAKEQQAIDIEIQKLKEEEEKEREEATILSQCCSLSK